MGALLLTHCGGEESSESTATTGGRPPRETPGVVGEGLSCELRQTFETHCWSCHGDIPMSGAPFSLINRTDLLTTGNGGQSRAERSVARMRATSMPMPPGVAPTVPDAAIKVVEDWIAAGHPAGECTDPMGGCTTCAALVDQFVACESPMTGGMPNLCSMDQGPNFFICSVTSCGDLCGLALPGQPAPPCDPAKGANCRQCLETNCKTQLEACDNGP